MGILLYYMYWRFTYHSNSSTMFKPVYSLAASEGVCLLNYHNIRLGSWIPAQDAGVCRSVTIIFYSKARVPDVVFQELTNVYH